MQNSFGITNCVGVMGKVMSFMCPFARDNRLMANRTGTAASQSFFDLGDMSYKTIFFRIGNFYGSGKFFTVLIRYIKSSGNGFYLCEIHLSQPVIFITKY
jgi:hypothetical protein